MPLAQTKLHIAQAMIRAGLPVIPLARGGGGPHSALPWDEAKGRRDWERYAWTPPPGPLLKECFGEDGMQADLGLALGAGGGVCALDFASEQVYNAWAHAVDLLGISTNTLLVLRPPRQHWRALFRCDRLAAPPRTEVLAKAGDQPTIRLISEGLIALMQPYAYQVIGGVPPHIPVLPIERAEALIEVARGLNEAAPVSAVEGVQA